MTNSTSEAGGTGTISYTLHKDGSHEFSWKGSDSQFAMLLFCCLLILRLHRYRRTRRNRQRDGAKEIKLSAATAGSAATPEPVKPSTRRQPQSHPVDTHFPEPVMRAVGWVPVCGTRGHYHVLLGEFLMLQTDVDPLVRSDRKSVLQV